MQLSFSSAWAGERQVPEDVQGAPVVRELGGLYRAATSEELLRAAARQLEGALGSRLPVAKPSAAIDYMVTRLALSEAVLVVLKNGLNLLCIPFLEAM